MATGYQLRMAHMEYPARVSIQGVPPEVPHFLPPGGTMSTISLMAYGEDNKSCITCQKSQMFDEK
jgi:hypothetical protein